MSNLDPVLRDFLDAQVVGVIATEPGAGHPRQSVVYYVRDGERLLVSSVAGRAKVRDVERSGWASLCVMAPEHPFPSATFSGSAEVLTQGIGPATAAVAQRFMQSPEPPEEQTDEALASVGRIIIAITIERVSAVSHLELEE
jgi:PPOX class probable F420-dependent enzyme